MSWIEAPRPVGAPTIPVLGASTVARTSQGSPSVDVLPPDEGVVLADVDSVGCTGSLSGSRAAFPNMSDVDGSGMEVSLSSLTSAVVPFSSTVIRVDVSCVLHPFSVHKLDAGLYMRLVTIAHAFNYRVPVLWDGVKSAIRVGCSCKAEGRFLTDTDLSWGQQVAVMFKIISTLILEVPSFLKAMAEGMSITAMHIVFVCLRIGRMLMCMIWPSCLGSIYLLRKWGMPQFIPG